MLYDVYDDVTGENYATFWTRAAAQAAVDSFHDENEIGIEGETPRAVAPVWQRWDWRALRLAPSRGRYPNGQRSLNAGPGEDWTPLWARAAQWTRYYWEAVRSDWRGARCQCGRLNFAFDECGWHYRDGRAVCARCRPDTAER